MSSFRRNTWILPFVLILALLGVSTAIATADETALPLAHRITDVPWHKQITGISCGAGSLEIVFDYWGPDIDQKEIADVARTSSSGTWPADIVRTGHFSHLSAAMGRFYPSKVPEAGFTARALGYAAFSHDGTTFWLDDLKALIAADIPVIVLMAYAPDGDVGHYRVVVGYDDTQSLIYFSDTWGRDIMKPSGFTGVISWSYADFETAWNYTDYSTLPFFGAVLMPWQVELTLSASQGTLSAQITYPCPAPMDANGVPAREAIATIDLPEGMQLVDQSATNVIELGTMSAGETRTVSWSVRWDENTTDRTVTVTASGIVDGSVPEAAWAGNTRYYPAYDYTDEIGGQGKLDF